MLVELLLGNLQIILLRALKMKNMKFSLLAAAVMAGSLIVTGSALADDHKKKKDVVKQIIKVQAEQGEDVKVVVGKNGERTKFDFSVDELKNMDNVSAELDGLDSETKEKVLHLLTQLNSHDAKIIELKDGDITHGEHETEIFVIKTSDGEQNMHIEIDVEGDGADPESRFHVAKFIGEGKGSHKALHKRMKWISKDGEKPDMAKIIKRMINKSELTSEQIDEIRALLDEK